MSTALEFGQNAGRRIDASKLTQARDYQRSQVAPAAAPIPPPAAERTASGVSADAPAPLPGGSVSSLFSVRREAAAGVELYASAANMRGVAAEAKAAEELVNAAKEKGELPKDAKVDAKTL